VKFELEREQAIKLIRAFLDFSNGISIPQSIVSILVSMTEQPDDKLRVIIFETLAEIGSLLFPKRRI
jgi:hypothetical protein